MLSVWPNLFDLHFLAPLLLRLTLGGILLVFHYEWWHRARPRHWIGIVAGVTGSLILVGLFLQPAALAAALVLLETARNKRRDWFTILPLLAIALALLVLGPGFLAFDFPL